MGKKLLAAALAALLLLPAAAGMAAKANAKRTYTIAEPKMQVSGFQSVNAISGLTLKADKAGYPASNVKPVFTLKNATSTEYTYDVGYTLEKQVEGKWYTLPKEPFTAQILLLLTSAQNSTKTLDVVDIVDGYQLYGRLTPGRYRLVKVLTDSKGKACPVAAEFAVTMDKMTVFLAQDVTARASASAKASGVFTAKKQEAVTLTGLKDGWAEVEKNGARGFVQAKHLVKEEGYFYLDHQMMKLIPQKYLSSVCVYRPEECDTNLCIMPGQDVRFDQETAVIANYQYEDGKSHLNIQLELYLCKDTARAQKIEKELKALAAAKNLSTKRWYVYKNMIVGIPDLAADKSFQYTIYKQLVERLDWLATPIAAGK